MTFRAALAVIPLALLGLAACETYDDGYGYSTTNVGVGYSYGSPYYGYNRPYYGPYGGVGYYDSFYDNFYGPIYGGYWATDGFFWYQTGIGGVWLRDGGRHFRHDNFNGARFQRFQAHERDVDNRNNNGGWYNDANQRRDNQNNPAGAQGRDDNGRGRGGDQSGRFNWQQPGAQPAPAPSAGDTQLDGGLRWNRGGDNDQGRGGGSSRQRSTPQPDATPAPAPAPQRQPWMRDRSSGGGDSGGSSERSDRGDRGGGWSGNRGGDESGNRSGGNDDGGGRSGGDGRHRAH